MTGGTSPTLFLVAFVVYIAVMIFIGWYSSRGKSEQEILDTVLAGRTDLAAK